MEHIYASGSQNDAPENVLEYLFIYLAFSDLVKVRFCENLPNKKSILWKYMAFESL
jgi:hypothetical protein